MTLARREFDVVLFEKNDYLGGQLYLASLPPHKQKMGFFVQYAEKQLRDLGVDVRLGTDATAEDIKALDPYAVVVATGSEPIKPGRIPGMANANVFTPPEILRKDVVLRGQKVAVIGSGLTGMECAIALQTAGNEVTIVEMQDVCGAGGGMTVIMDERGTLAKLGVRTMPGHRLVEIREGSVLVADNADYEVEVPCDSVVVSLGVRSNNALAEGLEGLENVFVIGEAERAGRRVADATHAAFQIAYDL